MKKHVLFILENSTVPPDARVWSEARAVREMGYEVTVISPKRQWAPKKYELLEGIEIYRHPCVNDIDTKVGFFIEYFNALFWEIFLSLKVFLKKPFHVIHGANPPDHIFIIALFYRVFGIRYIFDHHDLTPENYIAIFERADFLHRILLFMEKMSFRFADIIISTNESYRRIAQQRGKKNKDQVFVVRNGPDLSRYQFLPPNEKWREGFDYLVAYLGVIGKQEGIDNLLRSIHYLVYEKHVTNIKFIIVGTGPNQVQMAKMSEDMELSRYVHFTGFVPYEALYEILSTADLCVNPEFRNPFTDKSTMIKIMDYMVFGKPIVQYITTEGKVTAGEAAKYVYNNDEIEFAESMVDLLNKPDLRKKMGEIAKYRVKHKLNWNIQKHNLKKAYRHLEQYEMDLHPQAQRAKQ